VVVAYEKNKKDQQTENKRQLKVAAFILPKKTYKLTLLKSPMAHKTYSQEQFKLSTFKLVLNYKITYNKSMAPKNVISVLLFIKKYQSSINSFRFIGTNLLYLKNQNIIFYAGLNKNLNLT
jgi:hypothetical protein